MNPLSVYGNKVRIRACGICTNENGILLINHLGLRVGDFWSPPGGGIEFGESAESCISREFEEETGLTVTIGRFLFGCEFIKQPLHGIELFFEIKSYNGNLTLGKDPEVANEKQYLHGLQFMPWQEIKIRPADSLHGIFRILEDPIEIKNLSGYFKV